VAAGAYHSLFLRKDGGVWAWGQNTAGQLGTGSTSTTPQPTPTKVNGLPPIKALAAGVAHSAALDVNGNVWVWGQNASGQAGLGTAGGTVLVPTKVSAFSNIQAIAANGGFTLALGADGRVWAWGQNASGQVGTGVTSASVATPRVVAGLPTIRAIAVGLNHALALDTNGRVWGWGQNTSGQVGTGATSTTVLVPTRVANLPAARAIAAGSGHSLVIDEQFGNVWAWGQNNFGQVGTGTATTAPVLTPAAVSGLFAVPAISAGHFFSLAIMGDGFVKAWGHNTLGQLGNGSTANSATPANVTGLSDALALAAGAQHALALRPGCPVWGWGHNGQGQLGTGATSTTPTTAMGSTLLVNTFYFDGDMDGFGDEYVAEYACEPSPGFVEELDCDDYMPTTYPGAPEACNGVDDSCDGDVDEGNPEGGGSCSTGQPGVCAAGTTACLNGGLACQQNQQASAEQCDSLDNDCDGESDEGNPGGLQACDTGQQGVCGEGVTYCTTHGALECAPTVGPSPEVCDSQDNDCNGQSDDGLAFLTWYRDQDGDNYGFAAQSTQACARPSGHAPAPGDCNDTNPALNPGALEVCDGVDNDCDTQVDDGAPPQTWYRDTDGDGYGNTAQSTQACGQPAGHVASNTDCNDTDANIRPGATEVCDGVDNNCSGAADEGLALQTWYRDADNDTYGTAATTVQKCNQPTGYVAVPGDCNDANASIRPGAAEACDNVDNNCNGSVDENASRTWYRDADGDGYGTSTSVQQCSQPAGYVAPAGDCNDTNPNIKPGVAEVCDSVDNNCNGSVDDGAGDLWYRDADGDGYGRSSLSVRACSRPVGYVSSSGDCNDSDVTTYPDTSEACDGVDNNCNGSVDEGAGGTWYRDVDGDGYGNPLATTFACSRPSGYVGNDDDCNDATTSIRPGATEVCDGADNNCNGSVDEGVGGTWYRDADGDGYGSYSNVGISACTRPSGYVANRDDCNDSNSSIRPGATEVCDNVDNNCNWVADENLASTWYQDADGDGYGSASVTTSSCYHPTGYVSNSADCNDSNSSIRPGVAETCDSVDNNCNGSVDEGVTSTYYPDNDHDGYGASGPTVQACSLVVGLSDNNGDCNDNSEFFHPYAYERCGGGADTNCDGRAGTSPCSHCPPEFTSLNLTGLSDDQSQSLCY
jgi:hypothetical protein